MPRISLAVIAGTTAAAFVLAIIIDAGLESFNKILIVSAMLGATVISLFVARFIVLPALSRDANTPRAHLFTVAYSEAMLPATVGVIVAIFVNEWWVVLVFGILGAVFWLVVRDYLGRLPVSTGQ